jgi:hypothetical protein
LGKKFYSGSANKPGRLITTIKKYPFSQPSFINTYQQFINNNPHIFSGSNPYFIAKHQLRLEIGKGPNINLVGYAPPLVPC